MCARRECRRHVGLAIGLLGASALAAGCGTSPAVIAPAGPAAERIALLWWIRLAVGGLIWLSGDERIPGRTARKLYPGLSAKVRWPGQNCLTPESDHI
jgi:hypothetical protein